MATNFPTELDSLNNPTPSNTLADTGVVHSSQHDNANDAIEALQVKVGINSSANTNSLDYKVLQNTTNVNLKAPINSPTFTGTVVFPSNTSGANFINIPNTALTNSSISINGTPISLGGSITGLATLASPTFTGTVTIPAGASISGYLTSSTAASSYQPLDGDLTAIAALSGTSGFLKKTALDTWSLDTSTYLTSASISALAPLASPTFTGTVTIPAGASISGYLTSANAASTYAIIASPTFTGTVTLPGAPTQDLHAATKQYVDNLAAGINSHDSVYIATTSVLPNSPTYTNGSADASNGTGIDAYLQATTNGFLSIDSYTYSATLPSNTRVLVKDQADLKQNGIYYFAANNDQGSASTPWKLTRAIEENNSVAGQLTAGDMVYVISGNININQGWVMNSVGTATTPTGAIKIGTDNINWTQFTGVASIIAGTGITKSGNTLSVNTSTIATVASPTFTGTVTIPSGALISGYLTSTTAASTYAPINNAAFTGTFSAPAGTITSSMIASNTIVDANINSSAAIATSKISGLDTALSSKAPIASPTFTGTVTFPSSTSGANFVNIPNSALTNSSININGNSISLGSTVNTSPYTVAGTTYGIQTAGTASITTNSATTVDTYVAASYTSSEYLVQIKQGTKYRTSKVLVVYDGTGIYDTEWAILENGSTISGISIFAVISSTNIVLQVTISDAATTNATVKFLRSSIV